MSAQYTFFFPSSSSIFSLYHASWNIKVCMYQIWHLNNSIICNDDYNMSGFRLWMQRQICTWNILGVPPLLNLTSRLILLSLSWISKTPSFHLVVPSSPHLMRMRTAPPLVSLGTATAIRTRGAQNSGSGHNRGRTDAARDLQQKPWQKTRHNVRRETAWDAET